MEVICRALVLGLVLIAGTAIEQAPSVGPRCITFLQVIEGAPNDLNTIFKTLNECIHLSVDRVVIVNFELPIWVKAVDIIK